MTASVRLKWFSSLRAIGCLPSGCRLLAWGQPMHFQLPPFGVVDCPTGASRASPRLRPGPRLPTSGVAHGQALSITMCASGCHCVSALAMFVGAGGIATREVLRRCVCASIAVCQLSRVVFQNPVTVLGDFGAIIWPAGLVATGKVVPSSSSSVLVPRDIWPLQVAGVGGAALGSQFRYRAQELPFLGLHATSRGNHDKAMRLPQTYGGRPGG